MAWVVGHRQSHDAFVHDFHHVGPIANRVFLYAETSILQDYNARFNLNVTDVASK